MCQGEENIFNDMEMVEIVVWDKHGGLKYREEGKRVNLLKLLGA
jgi:hypothetical protein